MEGPDEEDDQGGFDDEDGVQDDYDLVEGEEHGEEHGRRVIIHLDMDAFYYQCEELKDPSLAGRPVGISQKYLIVTANYVARAKGVTKLQSIAEALKRCPDLKIINGEDLTPYRELSERIFELLRSYTPFVERLGFDETWYDVTERIDEIVAREEEEKGPTATLPTPVGHVYTPPNSTDSYCGCGCVRRLFHGSILAAEMRQVLKEKIGFRCCGGVATNKMLAKLAGEVHKPDQQTTILPQFAHAFLAPMPVRKLPGCGWAINKQLQALGVESVTDLRATSPPLLSAAVGHKVAGLLKRLCWGVDQSKVKEAAAHASSAYKTISEEDSFRQCVTREEVGRRMSGLLQALLVRVGERRDTAGELPHTLRLSLRNKAAGDGPRSRESRQHNVQNPETFFAGPASRVEAVLWELFDRMVPQGRAFELSLLNVAAANFQHIPGRTRQPSGPSGDSPSILRFVRPPIESFASVPPSGDPQANRSMSPPPAPSSSAVVSKESKGKERMVREERAVEAKGRRKRSRPGTQSLHLCPQCNVQVRDVDVEGHAKWHEDGGWHT